MPIEPVENPYRVIQSNKSRNVRRVERREPDEHGEEHLPPEEETEKEKNEDSKEEPVTENQIADKKTKKPPEDTEKPKIDIKI